MERAELKIRQCFRESTESGRRKKESRRRKKGSGRKKPTVQKVESNEEDSEIERHNKSAGKAIEARPALALLANRSEEDEINNNGKTMGGTVKLVYTGQTKCLN